MQKYSFYIIKLFSFFCFFYSTLFLFFEIPIQILSVFLIFLQVLLIYEYRKFKPLALLFVFVLPYSLVAYFHFFDNTFPLQLGQHLDFDNEKYYQNVFIILTLFWSTFALTLPKLNDNLIIRYLIKFKNQPLIFFTCFSLQLFILLFGRSGNNLFQSDGYGSADSTVSNLGGTAIFEYFLVLYPLSYVFSGNNRFKLNLLLVLSFFYCFKAISFGGRVEALQCILLIFILHVDNLKYSLFKILIYSILPITFFIVFGFIRAAPKSSIDEVFIIIRDNINLAGYTFLGNQIDVYYSSTRLFGLIDIGVINSLDRIQIFFYNIIAFVSPYSLLPTKANLALFLQDQYSAGGGGLLPLFFYVYLSYFGVILIAIVIGLLFRKIIIKTNLSSNYFLIYITMILATYPRWYAYSSNVFYKFCLYSIILLFILNVVIKIFYKKNTLI